MSPTENEHATFLDVLLIARKDIDATLQVFERYKKEKDKEIAHYFLLSSVKSFEYFMEAFKDMIIAYNVMLKKITLTDLKQCVYVFQQETFCNNSGRVILKYLVENEGLVYNWYDREEGLERYEMLIDNFGEGLFNIYGNLYQMIKIKNLLNEPVFKEATF